MADTVDTLPVLVSGPGAGEDDGSATRGVWGSRAEEVTTRYVSVAAMRESLDRICDGLQQVFQDARKVGEFRLTEVTVQVEVGAEGGFELIGTSKVSGKGAITLKFEA